VEPCSEIDWHCEADPKVTLLLLLSKEFGSPGGRNCDPRKEDPCKEDLEVFTTCSASRVSRGDTFSSLMPVRRNMRKFIEVAPRASIVFRAASDRWVDCKADADP
jgi:hypothetical protein